MASLRKADLTSLELQIVPDFSHTDPTEQKASRNLTVVFIFPSTYAFPDKKNELRRGVSSMPQNRRASWVEHPS